MTAMSSEHFRNLSFAVHSFMQGEEKWRENTTLGSTRADSEGCEFPQSHWLLPVYAGNCLTDWN